jgi:hypothetical protein
MQNSRSLPSEGALHSGGIGATFAAEAHTVWQPEQVAIVVSCTLLVTSLPPPVLPERVSDQGLDCHRLAQATFCRTSLRVSWGAHGCAWSIE